MFLSKGQHRPDSCVVLVTTWLVTVSGHTATSETDALTDISAFVGRDITITGTVSQTPWQHMIQSIKGTSVTYVDLDSGGQIVAYLPLQFNCNAGVRLTGRVMRVEGTTKRPGKTDTMVEYQLNISNWECVTSTVRIEGLIERLVDARCSQDVLRATEETVIHIGRDAIPVLIARLADTRPVEIRRTIANENLLINAPVTATPSTPEYRDDTITLGHRARVMLLRIITPSQYTSPYATNGKPFEMGPDVYFFRVKDWSRWWKKNKGKPLTQIHEEMKPVIDRYWQKHGVEQIVE